MKVGDMMRGLRWRLTANGLAHIIDGRNRSYCGVFVDWNAVVEDDAEVCPHCLKASEKYA